MQELYDKPLPNNIEAERMILGCVVLTNELFAEVAAKLNVGDFFLRSHQILFETFGVLTARQSSIDPVSILEELRATGQLEAVGNASYVASLFDGVPRFSNVDAYIEIVRGKSILRDLARSGSQIIAAALDAEDLPGEQLVRARRVIESIEDRRPQVELYSALQASEDYDAQLRALYASERPFLGVATNCYEFDYKLGGLQRTDLIVQAARPSMGKTSGMLRIASGVAQSRHNDSPVQVVFSLETPPKELSFRLRCGLAKVDSLAVRNKRATQTDMERLEAIKEVIAEWKLFFFGQAHGAGNVLEQAVLLRRVEREHKRIDAVYVDHLSFCHHPAARENRSRELDLITQEMKRMAERHNAPLIVLSQLSRANTARQDKRPTLSDLRESGAIEQNADVVIFLHREHYYDPRADPTLAEWNIAKQRNGPTGAIEMHFDARYAWFENRSKT